MAEISNTSNNATAGSRKGFFKKKSTRVDLTPMVDLGFILVSFFVFTSTLFQAKAMNILMPNDTHKGITDDVCASCAITLLPAANNKLYYYEGELENAVLQEVNYSNAALRNLLVEKKQSVAKKLGANEMVLIVKPAAASTYKNLINILDECNICTVKRYYIDEISETEKRMLAQKSPVNSTQ